MEEQLITSKTAKLAIKKNCEFIDFLWGYDKKHNLIKGDKLQKQCTQSLLQTWLRKKHNIIVIITPVKEKHSNDGGRDNISISKDSISNVFEIYIYQDNLLKINIYNEY